MNHIHWKSELARLAVMAQEIRDQHEFERDLWERYMSTANDITRALIDRVKADETTIGQLNQQLSDVQANREVDQATLDEAQALLAQPAPSATAGPINTATGTVTPAPGSPAVPPA